MDKPLDIEELSLSHEEEGEETDITDIYKELLTEGELILIIAAAEEPKLRRTLTVLKSKDSSKMKEAGFSSDDSKLEFLVLPRGQDLPQGLVRIQIVLKQKPKVRIFKKEIPSGDLT